jgi:hypothetical protein
MSQELVPCVCPGCRHRLRVPPDLLGQTVQCPQCNQPFTAPAAAAAVPPGPAWSLRGPGVALLLLSVWGLYECGLMLALTVYKPEKIQPIFDETTNQARGQSGLPVPALDGVAVIRGYAAVALLLNVLMASGAVCLIRQRGYWLAVAGCVAAALNLTPLRWVLFACLPAFPFGVWGLVGLLRPAGRAAFRRPEAAAPCRP